MSSASDYLDRKLGNVGKVAIYGYTAPKDRIYDNDGLLEGAYNTAMQGTGDFAVTTSHLLRDVLPNGGKNGGIDTLEDFGKYLQENYQHNYSPDTWRFYANAMGRSFPEMFATAIGTMGATSAATSYLGPYAALLGAGVSAFKVGQKVLSTYQKAKLAAEAAKAGKAGAKMTLGQKILLNATPSKSTVLYNTMASPIEAGLEGQRAMDDYIEEAKANGTYVAGQTEQEARNLRGRVFRDNAMLLALTNGLEGRWLYGAGKGVKNAAKGIAKSSLMEGLEEGVQQIIPKHEQNKPWSVTDRDVLESVAMGGIMGGGMHGIGRGAKAIAPSIFDPDYINNNANSQQPNTINNAGGNVDVTDIFDMDVTEATPEQWMNYVNSDIDNILGSMQASTQSAQGSSVPSGDSANAGTSVNVANLDAAIAEKFTMQDIEDKGLKNTNPALKSKLVQLADYVAQKYGNDRKLDISGGARSPENNAANNGAEKSHHLYGDAVDINYSMFNADEQADIMEYAKQLGFNKSGDAMHDNHGGNGDHMHLTYEDDGSANVQSGSVSGSVDISNRKGYDIARMVHERVKAKGYDIPVDWIWAQMAHESGNFESPLALEDHNYGGIKTNDGSGSFRHFDSDEAYADYAASNLVAYAEQDKIHEAKNIDDFAQRLFDGGYFTRDKYATDAEAVAAYANNMKGLLGGDGSTNSGGSTQSNMVSADQFAQLFANKIINFAGSSDSDIERAYQTIMDGLNEEARAPISSLYKADGTFDNTSENRRAVASNDELGALIRDIATANADTLLPEMRVVRAMGNVSRAEAATYLSPKHGGTNMYALGTAIKNGELNDEQKATVMQVATDAINTLDDMGKANALQSAVDTRDYGRIYSILPRQVARALSMPTRLPIGQVAGGMPSAQASVTGTRPQSGQEAVNRIGMAEQELATNPPQFDEFGSIPDYNAFQAQDERQNVVNVLNAIAAQKEENSNDNVQSRDDVVRWHENEEHAKQRGTRKRGLDKARKLNKSTPSQGYKDLVGVIENAIASAKQAKAAAEMGGEAPAVENSEAQPISTIDATLSRLPSSEGSRLIAPIAQTVNKLPHDERVAVGNAISDLIKGEDYSTNTLESLLAKGDPKAINHAVKKLLKGANKNETTTPESSSNTDNQEGTDSVHEPSTSDADGEGSPSTEAQEISEEENIKRGKEAMQKVINTHEDAENAMYRDDVGSIDFVWGTPGKGDKFKKGYGVSHILAKRDADYASGKSTVDGKATLDKIVEVIAKGTDTEVQNSSNNDTTAARIKIHHDGYTAVLSMSDKKNTWLLTGWEDQKSAQKNEVSASANGEGNGSTVATPDAPMRTRRAEETDTSVTSSVAEESTESNSADENKNDGEVAEKWYGYLHGKTAKQVEAIKKELAGRQAGIGFPGVGVFRNKKELAEHLAIDGKRKVSKKGRQWYIGNLPVTKATAMYYQYLVDNDLGKMLSAEKDAKTGEKPVQAKEDTKTEQENTQASEETEPQDVQESDGTKSKAKLGITTPAPANMGKTTTVITDSGKEITVTYALMPASRVKTSHQTNSLNINQDYPQGLQPRDRQRTAMQEQVMDMANHLRPADLAESRNLNQGAPIVTTSGTVLNGNGRAIAIKRAENKEGDVAKAYFKYLHDHAEEFGFTKEDIARLTSGHGKPILVRIVADDDVVAMHEDIINSTTGGSRMGASEQAKADAKKITLEDLNRYVENENGDLTTAANADFVAGIIYRVTNEGERNAYLDDNGNVNADGIQRVKRALFSLAYGDDSLIAKMAESTDDNTRNITNGLTNAAPLIAKVNLAMQETGVKYDLPESISEAVKRFSHLREKGMSAEELLNQQTLLDPITAEVGGILKAFDEFRRSGKKVSAFVRRMGELVQNEIDQQAQSGLIAVEPMSLEDIIETARKNARDGGISENLFDMAQTEGKKNKPLVSSAPVSSTNEALGTPTVSGFSSASSVAENNPQGNTKSSTFSDKETAESDSAWGDRTEIENDMLAALGLTRAPKETDGKGKSAKAEGKKKSGSIFTRGFNEEEQAEWDKLHALYKEREKAAANRVNSGIDPTLISPVFQMGVLLVKHGVRTFAQFAKTMISELGDSVRPWLRPVWEMLQTKPQDAKYSEEQLMPVFKFVGKTMEDNGGNMSYSDIEKRFADLVGKENVANFRDLLKVAYQGADCFYHRNEEVTDNELYDGTGEPAERDSAGDNQDRVGSDDADGKPGKGRGQGVQSPRENSRPQRSGSVHGRSSDSSGKASDSGVQGGASKRGNRNDSPGDKHLAGSVRDSYDRPATDDGRNAESIRPTENRPDDGRATGAESETVKVNKDNFKAGDSEQIAASLPHLLKEQVGDVVKAENRLLVNDGAGMMFTNGTGTGKTFTGLGVIARMAQQGKKNILIVAPTDKVQSDWITAGKGYFGLDITKLDGTMDKGTGIVITSYENVGANNALVQREWDMIVTDEAHKLMQGASGKVTNALSNIRAMTYHSAGLDERFDRLNATKVNRLAELRGKMREKSLTPTEKNEYDKLVKEVQSARTKAVAEWKATKKGNETKMLFLSATPFSYVKDIDYAEGYLFNYDRKPDENRIEGYNKFLRDHFGYRMRYGQLTKPDADVNQDLMEINFNTWLKNEGVLSSRKLKLDKDYERGYVLVDGGIGKTIDEGMKIATEQGVSDDKCQWGKLHGIFSNKLKGNKTHYLLEAIKAKNAIELINDYVKAGKKVVVFHDFKKNEAENPFILTDEDFQGLDVEDRAIAARQYEKFCAEHPELIALDLKDLQSPIERFTAEFGDSLRIFNGSVTKKNREKAVQEFNDDNSNVNIILCQRASAKEGISMHDTTGKHQRVLLDLGLATRPSDLIQCEGRIYRTGVKSNAIIRYLNTGTSMEKNAFATTIAGRSSTAENLSMGEEARALRDAIVNGFMETIDDSDAWRRYLPNTKTEGIGGKERDGNLASGVGEYDAAKSDYFANQKKNSRTKAQEGIDYYPTPEPIGYKMVKWLGLKPGDRVLEPSAGHGAISRYFASDTRNTIVEPSRELATLARMRLKGGETSRVVEDRFENLDIGNKYEGIVMNPPYGKGGKTAYEHVAKAFKHLADGGRLIAIVPDGPAANKHFEKWWNSDDAKTGILVGEINLPQVTFSRAGTTVATKILVIDKYTDADERAFAGTEITRSPYNLSNVTDINELFDKLEHYGFPDRIGSDIPNAFTRSMDNKTGSKDGKYVAATERLEPEMFSALRGLARGLDGYLAVDSDGNPEFHFSSDNKRATFIKQANKILAGKDSPQATANETVESAAPSQSTNFASESHENRYGKVSPVAKVKGWIDNKKSYPTIKSIAERYGGSYEKEVRGFEFRTEADRDAFIKEADAYLNAGKFSAEDGSKSSLEKEWAQIEIVDDSKLTPRERVLQKMGERMGVPIRFFTNSKRISGRHANGITFINRDVAVGTPWVFWHETFHWLKNNNPYLWANLVRYVQEAQIITQERIDNYKQEIGRNDLTNDEVVEELMADAMPLVAERVKLFKQLARENLPLYQRVIAWIKDKMDMLRDMFHMYKAAPELNGAQKSIRNRGLSTTQVDAMVRTFEDMALNLKDANGKHIFKKSRESAHGLATMNGRPMEAVAYSLDNSKELANRRTITYDDNGNIIPLSQRFDPSKNDIRYMAEVPIDKNAKMGDTEVTRKFNDIPKLAMKYAQSVIDSKEFARRIKPTDTVDELCDKLLATVKRDADKYLTMRDDEKNLIRKKVYLNTAALNVGIVDEVRRNFNAGGQIYRACTESPNVLKSAPIGSVLRRSIRDRGKEIARARADGGEIVVPTAGAVDGFAAKNQPIVDNIRTQDRGDGAKFSANLNEDVTAGANSSVKSDPAGTPRRIMHSTARLLGMDNDLESNVKDKFTESQSQKKSLDDNLPATFFMHSMKYLSKKNDVIKRFYYLGNKAQARQEKLRNKFNNAMKEINALVADRKDREDLQALAWMGDAEGREYTEQELRAEGFNDKVIKAYKLIRENLAQAYTLVNDARMQVKTRTKRMSRADVKEFARTHFVDPHDIKVEDAENGKVIVTYKGPKVYENLSDVVTQDMLDSMAADSDIAIVSQRELEPGIYEVTYNEKPKPLNKLSGYMPHMFHRFMVYEVSTDEEGKERRISVGSAESLADATKVANEIAKNNPDKNFVIDTHSFEYGDEYNSIVMGDKNFDEMTKRLQKNTEMTLDEAKKLLKDSNVHLKARHRYFGNMMNRTGAQGFDQNMQWALAHYFNSAARYVAMEEFKPDAITIYERLFGDFNGDVSQVVGKNKQQTARLIKQYILDVNGTPRSLELFLNRLVDRIPVIGKRLNDTYNGRAALSLSSKVAWFNAVTKLGCLNVASPMLNFMQFINVATMLDSYKYANIGLKRALKPSALDQKILDASGVMNEINLSSDAGGYTQYRDSGRVREGLGKVKGALNDSTKFFNYCDALMRKAAVLGAYYQAVEEKGMKPAKGEELSLKALEWTKEVNDEANFDYSAANTPEVMRMGSVITQQAFQFQKYPIMQFEFFWSHVVHGTNSQRAKFLMPYFLLTGMPGMLPFGELINAVLSALIPGDDDDFARKMKAELMKWAGDDTAKQMVVNSLTNGPLAAFTGIDISERAGMQNFFAGRYFGNNKPESFPDAVMQLLGGAALSTVSNVKTQIGEGNPIEAVKAISPGLGNIMQGIVGETRTTHHRIGSSYTGAWERILHAMGFKHIDETNTSFISSYTYETQQAAKEAKKYAMDEYLAEPADENYAEMMRYGVTKKELKDYAESKKLSARDRATQKSKSKKKTETQRENDELKDFLADDE